MVVILARSRLYAKGNLSKCWVWLVCIISRMRLLSVLHSERRLPQLDITRWTMDLLSNVYVFDSSTKLESALIWGRFDTWMVGRPPWIQIRGYVAVLLVYVPFDECLFTQLNFRVPCNEFEMGVLKHLKIAPPNCIQMLGISWRCSNSGATTQLEVVSEPFLPPLCRGTYFTMQTSESGINLTTTRG